MLMLLPLLPKPLWNARTRCVVLVLERVQVLVVGVDVPSRRVMSVAILTVVVVVVTGGGISRSYVCRFVCELAGWLSMNKGQLAYI